MRLVTIMFLLMCISVTYAETGARVGLSFLKIGVDARAVSMGNAFTAVANNASATYWNPAGLSTSTHNSVILMHNSWLQGINQEFGAIQFINGVHNIAVSLNMINISGIELRDETASENPIGETQALNMYLSLAYATKLDGNWHIGLQIKYLYEKYYLYAADGFALDLGIKKENILQDLSWGFVIQNIGKMSALNKEATKLPLGLRTGLSYVLPVQILEARPLIAVDINHILNDMTSVNLGIEVPLLSYTAIRLGYVVGRESQTITTGFGMNYDVFHIAYAFVPYNYDLGNSHRFSLTVDF